VPIESRMTFILYLGPRTDSTERGRFMWGRIKGKTENALFAAAVWRPYMLRPGVIHRLHGARSKTALYRFFYSMSKHCFR